MTLPRLCRSPLASPLARSYIARSTGAEKTENGRTRRIAESSVRRACILPRMAAFRASALERVCPAGQPSDHFISENRRAMSRHKAALAVNQRHLCVGNLPRPALAAQLPDRLGNREHRAGMARMAVRQQAAVRVDRQLAAQLDPSVFNEAPAIAFRAKTQIFKFDNHHWREAVVQFGDVDIFRAETRHRVRALARFFRRRGRETERLA